MLLAACDSPLYYAALPPSLDCGQRARVAGAFIACARSELAAAHVLLMPLQEVAHGVDAAQLQDGVAHGGFSEHGQIAT